MNLIKKINAFNLMIMLGLLMISSGVVAQITVLNKGTQNPSLMYKGKPMLKIGPLPEVVVFSLQWGSSDFPHQEWLDWMEKNGLGYGRVYPESGGNPWVSHNADGRLFPFELVDWNEDKPVVDLTRFNEAYWKNFKRIISECAQRGIVLQMQLYQRVFFAPRQGPTYWSSNYFNPENNINNFTIPKGPGGYGLWDAMAKEEPWKSLHKKWVEHILEGIGNNGNVMIDLLNEASFKEGMTEAWIETTLDIIENWERNTGNDILVGMDFDHMYKQNDPRIEYVLAHPRMELIICEGSESHVVPDLVAGDKRIPQHKDIAKLYREKYRKPVISTNSPGYSVDEELEAIHLYQWYSMMVKVQGVGVYAKKYPLNFNDTVVQSYGKRSKALTDFFKNIKNYERLQFSENSIKSAPGKYQLVLASEDEMVIYLHKGEIAQTNNKNANLVLTNLNKKNETKAKIILLHPMTCLTQIYSGRINDDQLLIELPEFNNDVAVHVLFD
ncbi:MAG: DUF6298 domain-containing protein [Candidatus Cyclobacteriaceae bacterium M3_2C_046]